MFELNDTALIIILFVLFFVLGVGAGMGLVINFPKNFLEETPLLACMAVEKRINDLEAMKYSYYYERKVDTISDEDKVRKQIVSIDKEIQTLKRWQRDHV